MFRPPGTSVCVRDHTPFGELGATKISLTCDSDFRVGDLVTFTQEDGGNLDTALSNSVSTATVENGSITALGSFVGGSGYTAGTYTDQQLSLIGGSNNTARGTVVVGDDGEVSSVVLTDGGSGYTAAGQLTATLTGGGSGFVVEIDAVFTAATGVVAYSVIETGEVNGTKYIVVSGSVGGAPITLAGDGGTGTADNPLPAHININLADYYSICGVRDFSLDITRDSLDVTTLPCIEPGQGSDCNSLASFRKTQSGFASATGTMNVYFTCDQENISNRLLGSTLLKNQKGARVKLYVCAKEEQGVINDDTSLFVEADISITGMSFSVNPDDPTTAELSFEVQKMISAFGLTA